MGSNVSPLGPFFADVEQMKFFDQQQIGYNSVKFSPLSHKGRYVRHESPRWALLGSGVPETTPISKNIDNSLKRQQCEVSDIPFADGQANYIVEFFIGLSYTYIYMYMSVYIYIYIYIV